MNSRTEEAARSHQARGLLVRWRFALLAAIVAAGGAAVWSAMSCSDGESQPPSAVIVDQLSLTSPNEAFVADATSELEAAGYTVEYVPGADVTVDFFRALPSRGYDIVLVRAHAGRRIGDGVVTADIFTSERYSATSYEAEQRDGSLMLGVLGEEANVEDAVFTIPAEFVERKMEGDFGGATVVLMGCDVLGGERLAQAFVERGADAVVGWDESVSAAHTDAATLSFLRHLLRDRLSVQDATAAARADVGEDPFYGSTLVSYPR
jgi:hypothetical protein